MSSLILKKCNNLLFSSQKKQVYMWQIKRVWAHKFWKSSQRYRMAFTCCNSFKLQQLYSISHLFVSYRILLCIMHTHVFGPNFQGEKIFCFNFLIQFCIYLYLDTCFLYYKGILVFISELLWDKKFYVTNNYKTQEQIQGISGTTHVKCTSLFFPSKSLAKSTHYTWWNTVHPVVSKFRSSEGRGKGKPWWQVLIFVFHIPVEQRWSNYEITEMGNQSPNIFFYLETINFTVLILWC